MQELIEARGLPAALSLAGRDAARADAPALVLRGGTARGTAPDEDPGPGRPGGCDQVLVLALNGRVGDLEDVEDVQIDVPGQLGDGAGHPDEPGLALVLKLLQRLEHVVLRHGRD